MDGSRWAGLETVRERVDGAVKVGKVSLTSET